MKILFKKVGQQPELLEIEPNLKVYQNLVGGLIECLDIEKNISIVFDEEGKLKGKEVNIAISNGSWMDLIVGDIFFIGFDRNEGEFISLTDDQIKYIMQLF